MSRFFVSLMVILSLSLSIPVVTAEDVAQLDPTPSSIPSSGTFNVNVKYVANGNRVVVADVLMKPNFQWFGQGWITVPTGSGTRSITVTIQNNPTPGSNYVINLWEVDANIWNNGQNINAWQSSTSTIKYDVSLGLVVPATNAPTPAPSNPTNPPGTGTTTPTNAPIPTTPPATLPPTTPTDPFGERVCDVKNSDLMQCSGCGYTICRNFVALYQTCDTGSCNSLTQQCDSTLPKCVNPFITPQNGTTPQHTTWWSIMLLGIVGAWIL